jgi:hypothetical protein
MTTTPAPNTIWARAAALPPGKGVILTFESVELLRSFQVLLNVSRRQELDRLIKEWEDIPGNGRLGDLPTTGWERLATRTIKKDPPTLWIGEPTTETYGITKMEEES